MNIELTRTELRVLMNALAAYTSKMKAQKMQNLVTNSDLHETEQLQDKIVTSYEGIIRRSKKASKKASK